VSFKKWMELDKEYVESANLFDDIRIIVKTGVIIGKSLLIQISKLFK
jgi:hypothetical protein